jgi:hypothetical protein
MAVQIDLANGMQVPGFQSDAAGSRDCRSCGTPLALCSGNFGDTVVATN